MYDISKNRKVYKPCDDGKNMTKITGVLKLNVLLRLSQGSVHGYELLKELNPSKGKISPSQVYPFLTDLKKRGFLSVANGSRGRKEYSLTVKGEKFVGTVLKEYESLLDVYVKEKVCACAHCECKIYEGGFSKRVRGKMKVFCCEHCAESLSTSQHQHHKNHKE